MKQTANYSYSPPVFGSFSKLRKVTDNLCAHMSTNTLRKEAELGFILSGFACIPGQPGELLGLV
jgi:hypothetical protein